MARTHMVYVMFKMAKDQILDNNFADAKVRVPLELFVKIYALKHIIKDPQSLYECGFFNLKSGKLLNESYAKLLVDLRPLMVPFVEYNPHWMQGMRSTIGNDHGDIYETQLAVAKNSRLNKNEVAPYYEKFMKPTMTMRREKL